MATAIRPIGHEDRLSIVDHLDELRTRIIICVVAFGVCFAFTYWQNGAILNIVNRPLKESQHHSGNSSKNGDSLEAAATYDRYLAVAAGKTADAVKEQNASVQVIARSAKLSPQQREVIQKGAADNVSAVTALRAAAAAAPKAGFRRPVTLGVTEPFLQTFAVAGYAALLLSLPLILYQLYAFLLPAFSPQERKMAVPFMAMVPVLFTAGIAFGYFVALPRAIDFLQNFNSDNFDVLVQANQYYKFSIVLVLIVGFLFQIPVAVLAVTRLGIVTPKQLAKNRGYVILALSIIAAVATPTPDPVTMLVTMAPLYFLFEFSLVLARIFKPKGPSRFSWARDGWEDEKEDDDAWRDEDDDA